MRERERGPVVQQAQRSLRAWTSWTGAGSEREPSIPVVLETPRVRPLAVKGERVEEEQEASTMKGPGRGQERRQPRTRRRIQDMDDFEFGAGHKERRRGRQLVRPEGPERKLAIRARCTDGAHGSFSE